MNTLPLLLVFLAGACMADVSHILGQQQRQQENKPQYAILNSHQDSDPQGNYRYGFETENGISAQAEGSPAGDVQGSYRYTAPDGQIIEVSWTAGPDGYVARGAAVPATPEHVLRTLEYNAAHPYKEQP